MRNEFLKISNQVVFAKDQHSVLVRTPFKIFKLEGEMVEEFLKPALPFLQQGITTQELKTKLKVGNDFKNFYREIISPLVNRGWVTFSIQEAPLEINSRAAFASLGEEGLQCQEFLKTKSVAVIGLSDLSKTLFKNLSKYYGEVTLFLPYSSDEAQEYSLSDLNKLFERVSKFDLAVYVEYKDNWNLKYRINNAAMREKQKILFSSVSGFNFSIGPTVVPQKTGCLECLNFRKLNNNTYLKELLEFNKLPQFGAAASDADSVDQCTEQQFVSMVTLECMRLFLMDRELHHDRIMQERPKTLNSVISVNTLSNTYDETPFLKNPRCEVCGGKLYQTPEVKPWLENYTYPQKKEDD